jgi:hypothetical protein
MHKPYPINQPIYNEIQVEQLSLHIAIMHQSSVAAGTELCYLDSVLVLDLLVGRTCAY